MSSGTQNNEPKKPEYKMWLAVRTDLQMSPGKLAVQSAHAFVGWFINIAEAEPNGRNFVPDRIAEEYLFETGSPKIAVAVDNEDQLSRVLVECENAKIACYGVRDAGRTELAPGTLTVVAFGPAYRKDLPPFLRDLKRL